MAKNLVSSQILNHLSQIRAANFFFKNLATSLDNMACYHHVQYQKKIMIQSWENLVTDGRTEGSAALWIWKKDQQQKNAVEYECYDGKT